MFIAGIEFQVVTTLWLDPRSKPEISASDKVMHVPWTPRIGFGVGVTTWLARPVLRRHWLGYRQRSSSVGEHQMKRWSDGASNLSAIVMVSTVCAAACGRTSLRPETEARSDSGAGGSGGPEKLGTYVAPAPCSAADVRLQPASSEELSRWFVGRWLTCQGNGSVGASSEPTEGLDVRPDQTFRLLSRAGDDLIVAPGNNKLGTWGVRSGGGGIRFVVDFQSGGKIDPRNFSFAPARQLTSLKASTRASTYQRYR